MPPGCLIAPHMQNVLNGQHDLTAEELKDLLANADCTRVGNRPNGGGGDD